MFLRLSLTIAVLSVFTLSGKAQSLIGSWQLVKQTTCLEDNLSQDTTAEDLVYDMKSMNDKTPQVLKFNDNQSGEETTKILYTRKNANTHHFLYKVDNATLYILDKKSRTIVESYNIDSFQHDQLILSNVSRACETKVFSRVK